MDKIVSLCKRRGFIFPGSEIYGGLANSWDYGPLGVELKNNIKNLWWERFVHRRSDIVGIDSALIMNSKVWEASGHLDNFKDFLIECKTQDCHTRVRPDDFLDKNELDEFNAIMNEVLATAQISSKENACKVRNLLEKVKTIFNKKVECPNCKKKNWTEPRQFNLMFQTNYGATFDVESLVYFRPETAQGMFVNFKNILDTARQTIPFGIAQIGKAFRNEITPGNFIFRTREFEMMEIEYFIPVPKEDGDWQKYFEDWRLEMLQWMKAIGINLDRVHELEVPEKERAHYSKRTIDFEYEFPFGRKELYGLAYRTNFDLKSHQDVSKQDLRYRDPAGGEPYLPHVIEPTWGVDRSVLAVLCEAYDDSEKDRVVLKLPPRLAPFKVAVFPLLANKPQLVNKAREIYHQLQKHFTVAWDDRGNVGKRYYSQDEIGTPFCITVDFDSLEDGTVTVRDRDTKEQPRAKVADLVNYFSSKL